MKRLALLATLCIAGAAAADDYVHGYVRRDGTYVAPYMRSPQNGYRLDNYSSPSVTNPYTIPSVPRAMQPWQPPLPALQPLPQFDYTPMPAYRTPTYRYDAPSTPGYGSDDEDDD